MSECLDNRYDFRVARNPDIGYFVVVELPEGKGLAELTEEQAGRFTLWYRGWLDSDHIHVGST